MNMAEGECEGEAEGDSNEDEPNDKAPSSSSELRLGSGKGKRFMGGMRNIVSMITGYHGGVSFL